MSVLLGKVNPRYSCLAYVVPLIWVIDSGLIQIGLKESYFNLSYEKFILIAGILHFCEGILVIGFGSKQSSCVVSYKGNKITGGYEAYRRWYIPLFLFVINGYYLPLLGVIGYNNVTYVNTPKEKAKTMGGWISAYGLLIILVGQKVCKGEIAIGIGCLLMVMLHETLFLIDERIEEGKLLFTQPKTGVRVIEVVGATEIERGDVLLEINGISIQTEEDYFREIKGAAICLKLEKLSGERVTLNLKGADKADFSLVLLPLQ